MACKKLLFKLKLRDYSYMYLIINNLNEATIDTWDCVV